jgi:RimJ/RimL family protein N-acetyltransferase
MMNSPINTFPIPPGLTLETDKVILRPLREPDAEDFLELAQDQDTWTYFSLNLSTRPQLDHWMSLAFSDKEANTRRPFTIVEKATGRIAGSTSMGNISLLDLRLEIGWSWLGGNFKGSGLNRHAKFAIMQYAFEVLGFERVEFKTDVLNFRARQGLRKVGGQEEGVLRSHMTMRNNRRRDSIFYSVIKNEWPNLRQTIFKDIETYEAR